MTPSTLLGSRADGSGATEEVRAISEGNVRVELLVLASVLLGAAGQLVLKAALLMNAAGWHLQLTGTNVRLGSAAGIVIGLCVYAVGTLFWVKAVSRAAISYLYPLSACSYALVAAGGHVFFGEIVHAWRWGGIAVITLGVVLMAADRARGCV